MKQCIITEINDRFIMHLLDTKEQEPHGRVEFKNKSYVLYFKMFFESKEYEIILEYKDNDNE